MKDMFLSCFRDRPGYIRPRLLPSALNSLIISAALGFGCAALFAGRGFPPGFHRSLGVLTGLVSLWALLHFYLHRIREKGQLLYRKAQVCRLLDDLRMGLIPETFPSHWVLIPCVGKLTVSDLLAHLQPESDCYFACAEPDEACRAYLTHPALSQKHFYFPKDLPESLLPTQWKGETLAWYARVLRYEVPAKRKITFPAPLSRILRALWVCGWFWVLSRLSPWGRDYYGMFCTVLIGCSLFWALRWALEAHARRQFPVPGRSGASGN